MSKPSAPGPGDCLSSNARVLLDLLRPAGVPAATARVGDLPPQAGEEILGIALRHGVAPLLHRALQSKGELGWLPDSVRARLEQERRATALDNLRNYGQFQLIARKLRERGIPVIALKGLHLAELVYRDISLRPMGDLDILVPHTQIGEAAAALRGLEYGPDADLAAAANAIIDTKCDLEFVHRQMDILLELHWSLFEPPGRYAAVLEGIWRSAVPARLGDAEALVMSPAFSLLHVCAHLACHHVFDFTLRALCDIAEIVRAHPELDWSVVIDHGQRHGWGRGIAAALRLACDQVGAAVPLRVLAALGADALDPGMLAEAMQHLLACGEMPDGLNHAVNLREYVDRRSLREKLTVFRARTFVSRGELALTYGVPEHSAHLWLYYAVRLKDLLRRYAASAWALNVSDPELAAAAARHARLAKWIGGG